MEKQVETKQAAKTKVPLRLPKKSLLIPLFSLLIVPLAVFATYTYLKQKPEVLGVKNAENSPQANQAEEALLVVARLSKIMQLPDEQPTVATVTDVERLASQPFFKNSKNGDKVVIFAQAKRAILYRDQENKVIEVGVVNSQGAPQSDSSVQTKTAPTQTPSAVQFRIAYFNGSGQVGAGRAIEDTLKGAIPESRTTARAIANKTDYEGNLVIDIGGSRTEDANRIAQAISGSVVALPEGERTPDDADFLVIVGRVNE